VLLVRGRIAFDGAPGELLRSELPEVRDYLGAEQRALREARP
jgi:hypothetical protein